MFENVNHIIFVASRDCNLRCAYCFEDNKDVYRGDVMSFETLQALIARIKQDKGRSLFHSNKTFDFSFHGGEPMLLGPEKTLQFINYVQEQLPNVAVSFSMQSNISLLSPKWYPLLKEHIHLGVSFDGFFKRNNLNRIKSNILGKNLVKLKKNNVGFGFVMVIQKNNIKDFMRNAQRLFHRYGSVKANLVENVSEEKNGYPEITSTEYFNNAFLPILKHFLKTGDLLEYNMRRLVTSFCENLLFAIPTKQGICNLKFCGGGTHMVQVEPDGKVSFCQRWSDKNPDKVIGNILHPTPDPWGLPSLLKCLQLQFKKIADIRTLGCDTCIAQDICNYGCMSFALTKYKGKKTIRPDLICDFYKQAAVHLYEHRESILFVWASVNKYKSKQSYDKDILLFELPKDTTVKSSAHIENINNTPCLKIDLRNLTPAVKLRYTLSKYRFVRKRK